MFNYLILFYSMNNDKIIWCKLSLGEKLEILNVYCLFFSLNSYQACYIQIKLILFVTCKLYQFGYIPAKFYHHFHSVLLIFKMKLDDEYSSHRQTCWWIGVFDFSLKLKILYIEMLYSCFRHKQNSILGSTFFIICVNNLLKSIKLGVTKVIYAGDTDPLFVSNGILDDTKQSLSTSIYI